MELSVTKQDQERICRFSVLAAQSQQLHDKLDALLRRTAAHSDAQRELEMILDEDEPVRIKCGSGFLSMDYEKAQMTVKEMEQSDNIQSNQLRSELKAVSTESDQLKAQLTLKYGSSIQLDH